MFEAVNAAVACRYMFVKNQQFRIVSFQVPSGCWTHPPIDKTNEEKLAIGGIERNVEINNAWNISNSDHQEELLIPLY